MTKLLLRKVATVTFILAVSACSSTSAPDSPVKNDGRQTAAAPVDTCKLLTPEEVTSIIGKNDGGKRGGGFGDSCVWENPDTSHSISLSIGAAGTAPSGQLDPESDYGATEPGPDGIRFASGNIAEFVTKDRGCEIQVVTSVTTKSDQPTAVRLIGLVRGRI
jgi:hypothetical protein